MSFPRYPDYKDSGVEWLGEVPGHWQLLRVRQVATLNPSKSEVAALPPETELSFLPMEAIGEDGRLDLQRTRPILEVSSGYTYFRDGDVTIAKITPCFENGKGAVMCGLVGGSGFGTTELIVARPKPEETTSEYLHWVFVSRPFRKLGEASMYGAGGQKRVPDDFVRDFRLAFPPMTEQCAISAFLDRETAKIDALVAEQQNLIALLKEKRQALISHAVTKGLDPDVRMKDSGVAWLGEVPAHWTLTKLKYSTSHIIDCPHETPTYCPDGDYLVVRTADVDAGALDLSNAYRLDEVEYLKRTRRAKLVPQDIVYGREGERWGYAATVPDEPVLCLGQRMMQFRARAGIAPRFLMWQLNSDVTYRQGQVDTVGATSPHVNVSTIANYVLTEPPFSEQVEIANYVDGATSEIDDLVSEARATVELLQERRTALISAAVTGKIDVRLLAVASAEPTPEPA